MSKSDHFVQNATKGPNIGLLIVRFLLANFWTQVVRSTNCGLGAIVGVLEHTGNPKISNFYLSVLGHEDVLCFKVSVQDFTIMNVLYCECHLHKPVKNLVLRVAD